MSNLQEHELERWPKYRENYLKAFQRMLDENKKQGRRSSWNTPEEVMEWWLRE